MGWGFRATCPDCRHEWEGTETSVRFGYWSTLEFSNVNDGFRSWFCPRCYYLLRLPRSMERNVWCRWHKGFLNEISNDYPFLREIADKLDAILSKGKFYVPILIDLDPGNCPECHQPFEETFPSTPIRLVCPECRGRAPVLEGIEFHCQMSRGVHGFS